MENKAKVWIARDRDGSLWVHPTIPFRENDIWFCDEPMIQLDNSLFPSVKWEDDVTTEAYITLAEPQSEKEQSQSEKEQPQPKQEVDWGQRRYEIVKELLPVIYQRFTEKELRYGQILKKECVVSDAVEMADILISKLKSENR